MLLPRFISFRDAIRLVAERPYYAADSKSFAKIARRVAAPRQADGGEAQAPVYPNGPLRQMDRLGLHVEMAMEVLGRPRALRDWDRM